MSTSSAIARLASLDGIEETSAAGEGGSGRGISETGFPSRPRKSSSSVGAAVRGGADLGFNWLRPNGSSSSSAATPSVLSRMVIPPLAGLWTLFASLLGLGMGKLVDASTGAAELKAARISSSSAAAGGGAWFVLTAGLWERPCSKLSQNWLFWPPYWASKRVRFSTSFLAFSSCNRFCCSTRDRFLFPAEGPKETRLAKLSPADGAGFAGELERFEAVDTGVDLPEVPFGRAVAYKRPELMGGGFWGAFELDEDQLSPDRSSILRTEGAIQEREKAWSISRTTCKKREHVYQTDRQTPCGVRTT